MVINLKGRVALVCGASQGMGLATAHLLAKSGANVVICSRNKDRLTTAHNSFGEYSANVLACAGDLTNAQDVYHIYEQAAQQFGRVDILVNNTGGPRPGQLETLLDDDWLQAMNQNFLSVVRMVRHCLPGMKSNRWGRIVNITSLLAKAPNDGMGLSNAMRAAVLGFSKTLSREVAHFGITINSICPGAIATERFNSLTATAAKEQKLSVEALTQRIITSLPAGFIGHPNDIANVILFLVSDGARYVNGTALQVDGGEYKGLF